MIYDRSRDDTWRISLFQNNMCGLGGVQKRGLLLVNDNRMGREERGEGGLVRKQAL